MPRHNSNGDKYAGIFVKCDPGEEEDNWSCKASAEISLKNRKGDDFTRSVYIILFYDFSMLNGRYHFSGLFQLVIFLFLKEQCVSWLFRTKYFEKKFKLLLLHLSFVSRTFILS